MTVRARDDGMEAGFLESPFGPVFVAYHPPRGVRTREAGLVFCDPFGSDRMNLHLAYRALALGLAERGFPVLRLDYPGTCDSAGSPRDPMQVASWLGALDFGAEWLKRRARVGELGAFGAFLGGTLAMAFAAARSDVRTLALWGAYPSGRAFLREMAAFRAMSSANPHGVKPESYVEGDEEAIGFLLTRATVSALHALEPLSSAAPAVRAAAIFRRNASHPVAPLADRLRETGAEVYVQPEAVIDMAAFAIGPTPVPPALVDALGRWWEGACPATRAASEPLGPLAAPARIARVRLASGHPVREEVVHFGDDGQLFGIVASSPVAARIDRPAVLLVNGGGNHRAGINRSHTEWSRAWVSAGLMVLRMDVRGLGDSAGGPYPAGKILYRSETQADVRAGLDLLAARYGHDRVIVIGLCAGAYQAFHVALADPRVVGLVMLNPLRFQSVDELAPGERSEVEYAPLGHYLRAALDVAAWRRLASEGRDPRVFVRFVAKRLHARVTGGVGELASIVRGRPPRPGSWLAGALLHLVGRGARVLVVFDDTNPIRPAFDESLAVDRERLAKSGSFRVELLTGADHIFSPLVSQERLAALLFDTLEAWTNLTPDLAAGGLVASAR